jgi:spermidine synthase
MDSIQKGWFSEINDFWPGQAMSLKVDEVLYHEKSQYQDIMVVKTEAYGRVLILDNAIQITEKDECAYQEMIAHLNLFSHPNPKKVLVVGGGDGGVIREVLRHPSVEEVHLCEIDNMVCETSKKYLPGIASGLSDPRCKVFYQDGFVFLKNNPNTYDAIITDSSDPIGPADSLFKEEYYRIAYDALKDGGIMSTQAESIWLHLDLIANMKQFIKKIFKTVEYAKTQIPTYPSGMIGFFMCRKSEGSCSTPVREVPQAVVDQCQFYNAEMHKAAFVMPTFVKRKLDQI